MKLLALITLTSIFSLPASGQERSCMSSLTSYLNPKEASDDGSICEEDCFGSLMSFICAAKSPEDRESRLNCLFENPTGEVAPVACLSAKSLQKLREAYKDIPNRKNPCTQTLWYLRRQG